MKTCAFCGEQNLDKAKFCCQCGKTLGGISAPQDKKRVFVPMCEEESQPAPFIQNDTPAPVMGGLDQFSMNNTSTKKEEDDAYADFKMRDRSQIFNNEQSDVFNNASYDPRAEKQRRKDAEKNFKRAEKQRKKRVAEAIADGKSPAEAYNDPFSNSNWQKEDFWN